jgi:hypothetical protein
VGEQIVLRIIEAARTGGVDINIKTTGVGTSSSLGPVAHTIKESRAVEKSSKFMVHWKYLVK